MPDEHARLSPSAAERWLVCPASIRMEAEVPPQPESEYALEGTIAHDLAEIEASYAFGQISEAKHAARVKAWRKKWGVSERMEFEMEAHAATYVELLREEVARFPHSQLMLEQRLDTGVPTCWGTSDAVIASPAHVSIVDYKYGQGHAVDAEDNPQLRLYALGALDTYGDMLGDTEVIRITVHQPRLGHVLTDEMSPLELRQWREKIIPIAEEALGPDARFGPSETACRWCPASGRCRAQMEYIFEDDVNFSAEPETLSEGEIADALDKVGAIRDWLNALEAAALDRVYSQGQKIPGYKVVLSGGKRSITDEDAAVKHAISLGYDADEVSRLRLRTMGELEALMTVPGFAEKMKDYIKPPTGKPSLVPESDKRPSVDPTSEAQKAFGDA